jgi:uncharacterized protein (DUF58 family)
VFLITSRFPFGLVERSQVHTVQVVTRIWPALAFGAASFPSSDDARLLLSSHRPRLSADEEFYSLREYRDGDHARHIHHPSSARRGRLVVRTMRALPAERDLVVLDLRLRPRRSARLPRGFERAISLCAGICWQAVRANHPMRLVVIGRQPVAFDAVERQLEDVLDHLAEVAAVPHRVLQPSELEAIRAETGVLWIRAAGPLTPAEHEAIGEHVRLLGWSQGAPVVEAAAVGGGG